MPRAKKHTTMAEILNVSPMAVPSIEVPRTLCNDTLSVAFLQRVVWQELHWFSSNRTYSQLELKAEKFTGSGATLLEAQKDCTQKVIDICTMKLQNTITDDAIRKNTEENFIWATQRRVALENGISVRYQYPTNHHDWKKCFEIHISDAHGNYAMNYAPPMQVIGFGRSPQEAKANACAFLIRACTLKLRHMIVDCEHSIERLRIYIDKLNVQLSLERSELDVFTIVKSIRDPKGSWSDAPKPAESEPVKVPS